MAATGVSKMELELELRKLEIPLNSLLLSQ
jgi:hypothetical protein